MLLRLAPACRGDILIGFVSAALAAAPAFLAPHSARAAAATEFENWVRAAPPPFTLQSSSGEPTALLTQRGKFVLVHFFATWCEPCRDEFPALNRLVARAGGAPVSVLAISVAEVDLRVRRFLELTSANFPVLLDRDRAVAKAWGIESLPATVILDENLKPRLVVHADFAWDGVEPHQLIERVRNARPAKQLKQSKREE